MPKRLIGLFLLFTVVLLIGLACGDDDDDDGEDGITPGPNGETPANGDLLSQFPEDVQPLLEGLPDNVVQALLDVRNSGPDTLVWKDSGGELYEGFNRAYLEEWADITGWEVLNEAPVATIGDLRAQVESGSVEWDVVEAPGEQIFPSVEEGLLQPLDQSLLQHYFDVAPEDYTWDDTWVEYGKFPVMLIYNTDVYGDNPPTSALDTYDTETYPGKRCFFSFPAYAADLEYALLADGVPYEDLYPLDVERALDKLDTVRSDVVFWDTGAESVQFVLDGQCDMGYTWQGRIALRLKDEPDLPLAGIFTDTVYVTAALAIPTGAPHYDAAMTALAYGYTAQNQCDFLNELGYGVPIDESCLNDFARTWAATEANLEQGFGPVNNEYYGESIDTLVERFNEWLTE